MKHLGKLIAMMIFIAVAATAGYADFNKAKDAIRYRQAAEGMDTDLVRPFRGRWTPLPDGRVRQYFEELTPDKKWQPWFEGFYAKAVE